ncbi:MAG: GntR family transcriptional regulator [Actinomycetota bacterium]|nr:GntR family transcriptional regulator [Actinomycetota bacterium]
MSSRVVRYRDIADDLRNRIEGDEFGLGDLLPSESELGSAYSASRVTVRKSLELLREAGLVDSRQGFGWFRATDPLSQSLSRLSTIEEQLAGSGMQSDRKVLGFAFVDADDDVAEILGVDHVLEVSRCNLADGQPFAKVTVWCPAGLAAELSRADVERASFVELLNVAFGGATQTIGADAASADDAALLRVPTGSPVLKARRVTYDTEKRAVLLAEHVFAAHRTEFVVDLPHEDASWAPAGLRLVR